MTTSEIKSKGLRVTLTDRGLAAVEVMIQSLRETGYPVRVEANELVSFVLNDYFSTYFEKEKSIFVAEFFDMAVFYKLEHEKAFGKENYEELVQAYLERAKQIRGKKRKPGKMDKKSGTFTSGNPA